MFFPIGWPKTLNVSDSSKVCFMKCNYERILFGILTPDTISIWYAKPCVPIVSDKRSNKSLQSYGENSILEWHPNSSMLIIGTNNSYLLFYDIFVQHNTINIPYSENDSPINGLQRDSAELFVKEPVPSITIKLNKYIWIDGEINSFTCIRNELMLSTKTSSIIRLKWDGTQNRDYSIDLRRIPFSIDQQISTYAMPITDENIFVDTIEYSPLIEGFAIVFNNGRAAFLTARSMKFDPNEVQGIWAKNVDDVICSAMNHKYRLIAFGRKNSEVHVMSIDETSGSLRVSHNLVLSTKDYPLNPGSVVSMKWTPDDHAIALSWKNGGISLWSTFGALLLCTLKWDYGLNTYILKENSFQVISMDWSAEGYQLWMIRDSHILSKDKCSCNKLQQMREVVQWEFIKSPLTTNPCMSHYQHVYLQAQDRLYMNLGYKIFSAKTKFDFSNENHSSGLCHALFGTKQWLIVPIPSTYTSCNWPIKFTAIDEEGQNIAVSGKTGLVHYSVLSRKWKLFGNEYQERDFNVTGGLLWYNGYLITSCYSIPDSDYEIRLYPRDVRLDNCYVHSVKIKSEISLLNIFKSILLTFSVDFNMNAYNIILKKEKGGDTAELMLLYNIEVSSLCPHPACTISVNFALVQTEKTKDNNTETILFNISGKLYMIQKNQNFKKLDQCFIYTSPIILAYNVENLWIPGEFKENKAHLTQTIWLFCGSNGMKVWLPLFPKSLKDKTHTFMNKRIMLPFHLKIYPLTILFQDAILLGAENDTVIYTSDTGSPFILPFSILELTGQIYLHQILRQLIHCNLGYHAWEIARSCTTLPYFSHSLELLLHEVLEEEATSKEPLPDAQLPSVVEFIQEFPGFWARAIVQCARKTEISLWPYLFSVVGPPKKLLQTCLNNQELDTAASYLLILQNLETSSVSKHYATSLLDAALRLGKYELSKDLLRFLKAIDPNNGI